MFNSNTVCFDCFGNIMLISLLKMLAKKSLRTEDLRYRYLNARQGTVVVGLL